MEAKNNKEFYKKNKDENGEVIEFKLIDYDKDVYFLRGYKRVIKPLDIYRVYRSNDLEKGQEEVLLVTKSYSEALKLYIELLGYTPYFLKENYKKHVDKSLQTA